MKGFVSLFSTLRGNWNFLKWGNQLTWAELSYPNFLLIWFFETNFFVKINEQWTWSPFHSCPLSSTLPWLFIIITYPFHFKSWLPIQSWACSWINIIFGMFYQMGFVCIPFSLKELQETQWNSKGPLDGRWASEFQRP